MLNLWHLATFWMNILLEQNWCYELCIKGSANETGERGTKDLPIFMMHT